jgi:23S rRNA (guanine2445-N2)-methyltransferase / 23S rRNA (guanine2069-N7)-methyltransferase
MPTPLLFFASTARALEPLLAAELRTLGAEGVEPVRAGVHFRGTLETAYRACLWSRTASRVLLPVASFPVRSADDLYAGVQATSWNEHLAPGGTLAVNCAATALPQGITNTHYAALRVKDAMVDQLRDRSGGRPSVDTERPDLRVNLLLQAEEATLRIDLSGQSLHRRAYRIEGGRAPLKENLAAGLLLLAGWPDRAREGAPFLDPMCGSGTLTIEAALIASNRAPGLLREHFGFLGWRGHDREAWSRVLAEAQEAARGHEGRHPRITGYDADPEAVRKALANLDRAGVRGMVHVERRELSACTPLGDVPGLLLVNPPYGRRLGESEALIPLYARLGDLFKQRFVGWEAYVLTGSTELARYIGLKPARRHVVYNGPLECRLLHYPISAGSRRRAVETPDAGDTTSLADAQAPAAGDHAPRETLRRRADPESEAFSNRLTKNLRRLRRWARREGITCYRVYDADLPEYAVAVDLYEQWVHVQEYAPPSTVDAAAARRRLRHILSAIPEVLGVPPEDVFLKVRRRRPAGQQYQKLQSSGMLREVHEGQHRFLVNLTDYLDTGLFLDHRLTRALIGELAPGRSFLNLFAYTGTATVYAAKGGASSTLSVDLSATHLDWARRNLALNSIRGPRHELLRADCLEWLRQARRRFGLIFLDPPTFSNSKAMRGTFDVQRDHVWLIHAAARLLEPDGVLLFSTNAQRFTLDEDALPDLRIEDLSRATLPHDFERNPKIHRAYKMVRMHRDERARSPAHE